MNVKIVFALGASNSSSFWQFPNSLDMHCCQSAFQLKIRSCWSPLDKAVSFQLYVKTTSTESRNKTLRKVEFCYKHYKKTSLLFKCGSSERDAPARSGLTCDDSYLDIWAGVSQQKFLGMCTFRTWKITWYTYSHQTGPAFRAHLLHHHSCGFQAHFIINSCCFVPWRKSENFIHRTPLW